MNKKNNAADQAEVRNSLSQTMIVGVLWLWALRRFQIVVHVTKISADIVGQTVESYILDFCVRAGLPASSAELIELALRLMLWILLIKWVADLVFELFHYFKINWRRLQR